MNLPLTCGETWVADGFEPLLVAFERIASDDPTSGRAMCAYADGKLVADLWSGEAYESNSVHLLFSVTKGITALAIATLVERGDLSYDEPVHTWWPELQAAKNGLTVAQLLSHQAGIPYVDGDYSLEEWQDGTVADVLSKQKPIWVPGTRHGYHALTFGVLANELALRSGGRSIKEIVADDIANPLGAEYWLGLPEEIDARYRPLQASKHKRDVPAKETLVGQVIPQTPLPIHDVLKLNERQYRAAALPAGTGVGSARGLATIYASCLWSLGGVEIIHRSTLAEAVHIRANGFDLVDQAPVRYSAGFHLSHPATPMAGRYSFGHDGYGGAIAFADTKHDFSFAYVTDRLPATGGVDPVSSYLVSALTACRQSWRDGTEVGTKR